MTNREPMSALRQMYEAAGLNGYLTHHTAAEIAEREIAAAVARVTAERDEARAAIRESREFLARVARAYTQWMEAIGPRDTFSFPKDAEEHNGIVKHMHDMMALLVEFSAQCPPYAAVDIAQESVLAAERAKVERLHDVLGGLIEWCRCDCERAGTCNYCRAEAAFAEIHSGTDAGRAYIALAETAPSTLETP